VESFFTLQGILWGPVAAAATISVAPMLIFVLVMQRYMVRGLTFGAVRG
jgi:multiple sugar transport system permease protein